MLCAVTWFSYRTPLTIYEIFTGYHGIGSHVEDHLLELGLDAIRKETERYVKLQNWMSGVLILLSYHLILLSWEKDF